MSASALPVLEQAGTRGPLSIYSHLRKTIAIPGMVIVGVGATLLCVPSLLSSSQVLGLTLVSIGAAVVAEEFSKAYERRERVAESFQDAERFQTLHTELIETRAREAEALAKLRVVSETLEETRRQVTPLSVEAEARRRALTDDERSALLAGLFLGLWNEGPKGALVTLYPGDRLDIGSFPRWSWYASDHGVKRANYRPDPLAAIEQALESLGLNLPNAVKESMGNDDAAWSHFPEGPAPRRWDRLENYASDIRPLLRPELQVAFDVGIWIAEEALSLERTATNGFIPTFHGMWLTPMSRLRPENVALRWVSDQLSGFLDEYEKAMFGEGPDRHGGEQGTTLTVRPDANRRKQEAARLAPLLCSIVEEINDGTPFGGNRIVGDE